MSNGVSVVICCHNSAKRLPETLRHLALQKTPGDLPWEVVVIDNASTDDTAAMAVKCWPAPAPVELRVVREPEAGLSHARIRGIREARYEVIGFIDDDNWAPADWVERVSAFFTSHPEVGACGGRIEAICETSPPAWFAMLHGQYAVGRQHGRTGDITDAMGTLLCGAGLSLRASAARQLLQDGFRFRMTGRKGASLISGEDTELCFALRASGWRLWYDDDLVLRHFIPASRLQWHYALRLMRGNGQSSAYFGIYLMALKRFPYENRPRWKKSWLFAMAGALICLVSLVIRHPIDCLRRPPGSSHGLTFVHTLGRIAALWALRGEYSPLMRQLADSTWARPKAGGPSGCGGI